MYLKAKYTLALTLALALCSGAAFAQEMSKSGHVMTPQQQKMADCSKQSTGMKGEAHNAFMSNCLKGNHTMSTTSSTMPAAAPVATAPMTASTGTQMTQRERMRSCSSEAKTQSLKGESRKTFMSSCLKGGTTATTAATMPTSHTTLAKAPTSATHKESKRALKKDCRSQAKAKSLKGEAYKSFVTSCVAGG